MKILSWNVRGLGRSYKRHLVKDVILSVNVDIICLQESKLQEIHSSIWRSTGGLRFSFFYYILVQGTSGGIITAWDRSQVLGTILHKGSYSISITFKNILNNNIWACINVYGPISRNLRSDF